MKISSEKRHFFELLWAMTDKELRARYKNTIFGFLWIIINPLLQMLVIGTIFRFFLKELIENYYFYLLIGLLIWNFFSLSLTKATSSIVYERSLIKKAKFPVSIIPLSIIASNGVHMLIAFGLLLLVWIPFHQVSLHIVFIIPILIWLFTLTVGISLFTSALNVRFRDVAFFIQALLIIWFYATPIVYSIKVIPYQLMWLWRLNPLTAIVQVSQYAIISAPPPGIGMLISNGLISIILVLIGIITFQKECKNFDDWV